ncbi:unnamed protein product [Caenorhabditis brenneri]
MDYAYESKIIESFEYVDESEVPSGDESSELSMVLEEMKRLRMENAELKNDNSEIKEALRNLLTLQMTILEQVSRFDLGNIENAIDSLKSDNCVLHEAIYSTQQEILNVKYLIKNKERSGPYENIIETEINGEWKLIESNNVDDFLYSQTDIFPFEASRIRHSNVCFEFQNNQVKTCNWFSQYSILEVHYFGIPNEDGVLFFVKDNKLISVQKSRETNGEVFSTIERFIENGKLHIVWERNGFTCERVYEKLDNWSSNTDPFKGTDSIAP